MRKKMSIKKKKKEKEQVEKKNQCKKDKLKIF